MTLAPDMRSRSTRRKLSILLIGVMAIAIAGFVALRGTSHEASAANPDFFAGTAHVEFPGSPGFGPYDVATGALINGSGTTIYDLIVGSFDYGFNGAFYVDTLAGWNFSSPFSNYAKGTLVSPCPCNVIEGPPAPAAERNMAANTKIRVTLYNNQDSVLIQLEGTSGGRNFKITFTGSSCTVASPVPECLLFLPPIS
ncbi:hypothetical protein AYO38_07305 [bacterium SCGC AG-212-C10]|nr:hypothetical protein AYO38_07305 [bacterium SCGC AG-212-C10]